MTVWTERISPERAAEILRRAIARGLLEDERALVIHDLDLMQARIAYLRSAFPTPALHSLAVKANPVVPILKAAVEAGAGLECASWEEVMLSRAAGCEPAKIVFDSPAKTVEELRFALELGLHLNADNFDELARIGALIEGGLAPAGPIGLRINPMVGAGTIATTSVSDADSRFGVALEPDRSKIIAAFERYPWLNALHAHVGSQGVALEQLIRASERLSSLADEIDTRIGARRIEWLDVGGGLPARYDDAAELPSLSAYAAEVSSRLEGRDRGIVTEFGRAIQANCGFAVSRIEYVKRMQRTRYAVVHLGADFLMRPVYQPQAWRHEVFITDALGNPRTGEDGEWNIAGPLCFGGDVIARSRVLPEPRPDDYLVVRDVGAYTLSMWSRHCSRGLPPVIGVAGDDLTILKRREQPEDVVAFWSG